MALPFSLLLVTSLSVTTSATPAADARNNRCEPVTFPLCKGLPYSQTMLPNLLNHQSQEEAAMEVHQYTPLVQLGCSADLKNLLCSVYAPNCTDNSIIPPCRSLCMSARYGCQGIMDTYGFRWPQSLECSKFPADFSSPCYGQSSTGFYLNHAVLTGQGTGDLEERQSVHEEGSEFGVDRLAVKNFMRIIKFLMKKTRRSKPKQNSFLMN